ncbi:MAG: ATP-binding protein [Cyclobacteriaceae bacterium]|nr:ATP-binding protein [Cyclobacteriaceae bacterium]
MLFKDNSAKILFKNKHFIFKLIGYFVFCIIIHQYSYAQKSGYHPIDFYDNKNGLSQGTVNCIIQDKYGYMWFGTQDGLNKFDGVSFTVYKNDIDDPNSISDNYITDIAEDSEGNLWIGTRSGGLNRYDINSGVFKSFKNKKNDSLSLSHNWVTSIEISSNDMLWVGTFGGGLNYLNPKTGLVKSYTHNVGNNFSISDDFINTLYLDKSNNLWIGTKKGLNKLNNDTQGFTTYKNIPNNNNSLNNDDITSIWQDSNLQLWLGTNGGGLSKMISDKFFETYKTNEGNQNSISNNAILALHDAGDNKIWVGTNGGGLNYFDPETNIFIHYKLNFTQIKAVYRDNEGDVWVGLRGGLNRIGYQNSKFTLYSQDNKGNLISENGDIHALCEDKEGFIWVGSSVTGLKKVNRETLEVTTYNHTNNPKSLSNDVIRFLYIDHDETMWVSTAKGLNKYNKKTDSFTVHLPKKDNPNSISSEVVGQIIEDSKNNLWICTNNGLNIFDQKTGKFSVLNHSETNSNSLHSNNVSTVIEDQDGIFWIGFVSEGLDRYDPTTGDFTHYDHKDDDRNSLSNERISHIHDDKRGNIWIATYGGGLNKFNKKTKTFTHYNEKQGLANIALYCVLEDENNNLWMSHNEGVSKFDITTETFNNYLEGVEFNGSAFYQSNIGEIFIASFDVVSFFPKNIINNNSIPIVHINEFRLFNEVITPLNNKNILDKVVEETDTITLKYNENFFSFGFVSLNFSNSENSQFKYKLENFDDEWNKALGFNHANYTNVPPGNYTFRVIGSNNDQLWNEVGDTIYIHILSPWWDTLLFKIFTFTIIISLLVIIYRTRLNNIQKQKRDLERLVGLRTREVMSHQEEIILQKENISKQNEELISLNEEKNNLIQMVSHDLRSPLNQVKGLTSIIKIINPDLNKETNDSINLINDLVDRQRNMIGKVLDTKAIDSHQANLQLSIIKVNKILLEVINTIEKVASNKNISITQELYNESLCIEADENYLIQVLENILYNAVKFSPLNKNITISTYKMSNKAFISVKDEGPGIKPSDMKLLFEPFTKLSAKPTGNEDSSGLGLSIAKKYMDMMNGKIKCESEVGKGSNFILEFDAKEC